MSKVPDALGLTGKASDFLKVGVAAAGKGDIQKVKKLVKVRPQWITRVGSHGRTMLWEAAYRGRTEMVRYLIGKGADIDACGCHFTPLLVDISPYCAARYKKHDATADELLEHGAKVDFFTDIYLGDIDKVKAALDSDPSIVNAQGVQKDMNTHATALHYAVAAKQIEVLTLLLSSGADPKPHSAGLIRFAIARDRADILKLLFDAGVNPMEARIPRSGVTNREINELLDSHGVPHHPDQQEGGWPPLVYSARGDRGGNVETIREILDQGANVNVRNYKQQTALHCAAKAGFVDIVMELLSHEADVDAEDQTGDTPLMTALRSTIKDTDRLTRVVQILLKHGADLNHTNKRGETPIAVAQRKKSAQFWSRALTQNSDE